MNEAPCAVDRISEGTARNVLESIEDGFYVLDRNWRFVLFNDQCERYFGRCRASVLGLTYTEAFPAARGSAFERALALALETGHPQRVEARSPTTGIPILLRAFPTNDGVTVIFTDVSERHAAKEALERRVAERTEELQTVVREMESFNYSVSHDLRGPLRNIAGMASILLEEMGPELSEDHRNLLNRQVANVRRMGHLIDELLRLSRLSRAELNRMPLDMTIKAREVADSERASNPIKAIVEVQEGMRAEGDPNLIRALLQNLIGNALKFSPEGGTVRVKQSGGAFSVSDEGIGFDMAHATRIFLPFERLVRESEFPGTGIGLANVERIVRRHGGRVWADSSPGQGATFSFTLGPELAVAA